MRRAKNENGERRFAVDEFLSPQQIKSYFSRSVAKINQARSVAEIDVPATDEEMACSSETFFSTMIIVSVYGAM